MPTRARGSKRAGRLILMILGILVPAIAARPAEFVTPGEMERKSDWVKTHLASTRPSLPFSFVYGGKASSGPPPGLAEGHGNHAARRRPHAAHHDVDRSGLGPPGSLRGGRVCGFPRRGMDGRFQEHLRSRRRACSRPSRGSTSR